MREYTCTLAGEALELTANFKASMEIAKEVGDPLMIAREAALEAMMLAKSFPYNPRWSFTIENVPQLLHIGVKMSGSKITLEHIQELVFDEGFASSRDHAIEYLSLIVGPAPEEELEDSADGDSSDGKSPGNVAGPTS